MGSQIHNYKPEFSWLLMGNQGKYHVFGGDFRKQSYVSQSHINFLVLDLWIWLLAFRMHKEQENKMDKQSLERKISYKLKIVFRIWELNLVKKKNHKDFIYPSPLCSQWEQPWLYPEIHPIWYKCVTNDRSDKNDIIDCSIYIFKVNRQFSVCYKGAKDSPCVQGRKIF